MRIVVQFTWHDLGPLGLVAGRLVMPEVVTAPAVYRFRVAGLGGDEVYIGQSDNLRRRVRQNYAGKHSGPTNVRIRELLVSHLAAGREVRLAIVSNAKLDVEGESLSADLSRDETRLLIENAALMLARRAGDKIHNL